MTQEPTHAYPPRYWWFKRITLSSIILFFILLCLRIAWGYDADHQLNAEVAAIYARGEPILPDDFPLPHVPNADNYVYYMKQALAALNPNADPPAATSMVYAEYPPFSQLWYSTAAAAVVGNQKSLQLIHQARSHDQVDWNIQPSLANLATLFSSLNASRQLANVLGDTALYQNMQGNDAECVETLRDLLASADALDRPPWLIDHLVAVGIRALAVERIAVIAPGLQHASRPAVQAVIAQLLDYNRGRQFQKSIEGERCINLLWSQQITQNNLLLQPFFKLHTLDVLHQWDAMGSAAAESTLPAAQLTFTNTPSAKNPYDDTLRGLSGGPYQQSLVVDYRVDLECKFAAISLATQLYRIDHAGQWPPNLQALVPDYLPAVPLDPMNADGRPIGYQLTKNGRRPILYMLTGGKPSDKVKESWLPPTPQYDWTSSSDQIFDLSRFAPPQGATQPAQ